MEGFLATETQQSSWSTMCVEYIRIAECRRREALGQRLDTNVVISNSRLDAALLYVHYGQD